MEPVDTKQQLLDAAKSLFALKGYAAVSVKEICEKAGANVSLVSYYFEGKEGLYRACLEQFSRHKFGTAERLLQAPKSIDEIRVRLVMFAEELMRCHVEDPEQVRMVQRAITDDTDTIAADVFDRSFVTVFDNFLAFLKSAQESALLRKDVDVFIAATMFFGSLMHFGMTDPIRVRRFGEAMAIRNLEFRKHVQESLVDTFLRGVGA